MSGMITTRARPSVLSMGAISTRAQGVVGASPRCKKFKHERQDHAQDPQGIEPRGHQNLLFVRNVRRLRSPLRGVPTRPLASTTMQEWRDMASEAPTKNAARAATPITCLILGRDRNTERANISDVTQ